MVWFVGVEGGGSEDLVSVEYVGVVAVDDAGDFEAGVLAADGDPPGSRPDAPVGGHVGCCDSFGNGDGLVGGSGFGVLLVD